MRRAAACPFRICRDFSRMQIIAVRSEQDAVAAVREARERATTLEIRGAGTKRGFGRPFSCDAVVDCSPLAGIVSYDPGELVITVRPGTAIGELADAAAQKKQRFAFDPADWGPLYGAQARLATIGGVIASDSCGSARVRFGAVRDHLLGFRAVNGLGESYSAGGKVVKNVTGFDLPKLVCGALGTLGILTELTLRVLPAGERVLTLALRDMKSTAAFAMLRRVWASPLEATGLAFLPPAAARAFAGDCGEGLVLVRIEGSRGGLSEKLALLHGLCARDFEETENGEVMFHAIGDGAFFAGEALDVWRITIPPARAAEVARAIEAPLWLADWAGALLWAGVPRDDGSAAARVRAAAAAADGHAVLLRASIEARASLGVFAPEPPARAALTKAVKAAFDPLGLFNPGRMFEGV